MEEKKLRFQKEESEVVKNQSNLSRNQSANASPLNRKTKTLASKLSQMKLEALRQHATARLDRHDEALGMNSRTIGGDFAVTEAITPPPSPNPNQLTAKENDLVERHYVVAGKPRGPVRQSDLLQELSKGYITNKTLIWNPNMKGWLDLGQVQELIGRSEQGKTSA